LKPVVLTTFWLGRAFYFLSSELFSFLEPGPGWVDMRLGIKTGKVTEKVSGTRFPSRSKLAKDEGESEYLFWLSYNSWMKRKKRTREQEVGRGTRKGEK
jgi:hypothetical protein